MKARYSAGKVHSVQILNITSSHWIVASNVNVCEDSCYTDSVCIYDSGFFHISLAIKNTICQFLQPKSETFFFDLMNIQSQPNGNDCGLFALACATELVHGYDPLLCNWDLTRMRMHLLMSLESSYMGRFPCIKQRRVPFGSRVRKSSRETLCCSCRMRKEQ